MSKIKGWKKINSFAWADGEKQGVVIGRDWYGKYGVKDRYFLERWTPSTRKILKKNVKTLDDIIDFAIKWMKKHKGGK